MARFNQSAIANLPAASKSQAEAVLMEYSIDPTTEKKLWTFLYNPSVLRFSGDAKYSESGTFAAREQDMQYGNSTGLTLEIPNLYLDSYCLGKSLKPLLEGIDELRKADIKQSRFSPPILSFVFGSRRFSPCVLTRVGWDEVNWLGGEPARAQMNLTLQQIPEPGKLGLGAIAPELQSLDQLPADLTERQREEGSAAAKEHLNANIQTLSPEVQGLVRSNAYKLGTDAATGDVTMVRADGTAIGVVGRWDGKELATENVSTLPNATTPATTSK
jgi:hypothetical protein